MFGSGFGFSGSGVGGSGGPIGGGGTLNYIAKFTPDGEHIADSLLFDDGTSVGLGTITPKGKFNLVGVVNGINQRLEPVSGVTEDTHGSTVSTTDASPTTVQTISTTKNSIITIVSVVTYRKTGGSGAGTTGDGTSFIITTSVKNVNNSLTIDNVQNDYTGTLIATESVTFSVSTSNVVITVTGINGDNITWNVITKVFAV